jgi:hypothetical protein
MVTSDLLQQTEMANFRLFSINGKWKKKVCFSLVFAVYSKRAHLWQYLEDKLRNCGQFHVQCKIYELKKSLYFKYLLKNDCVSDYAFMSEFTAQMYQ